MKYLITLIFVLNLFSFGCSSIKSSIYKNNEIHIATVNNNVCKRLKGKTVIYAIFVDSDETLPWTEFDINSTLDSIQKAMDWIEGQARNSEINLNLILNYHEDNSNIIPIEERFVKKKLSSTLLGTNGIKNVDKWADKVSLKALKTFSPDNSEITRTKIKPKNRERLIARIRDINNTDNVALMYFINNYYKDEISIAMHTSSNDLPEYAIVSFKNPQVIIHEFLHLFGALDLYINPFLDGKKNAKRKAFAMKEFPNEIMAFTHKNLDSLELGPFTKYLIGWDNKLEKKYSEMLVGKKINLAKY